MRRVVLTGLVLVMTATVCAPAQAQQTFREQRARVILVDAINTGTPLFNAGDWTACYGVYQGALLSVQPLMYCKPCLQTDITRALQAARNDASYYDKAWRLRHAIDRLLEQLR